jgi:hypothetical protein
VIRVQRPDLQDPAWVAWRDKAISAIAQLAGRDRPDKEWAVKDELYKEAMPFLLRLTHDKCAYCEVVITSNQPGDVEHYRPKGRIKELDGKVVRAIIGGEEVDHPGYWWLCYEWRNLLPSCIDCNRRRRHGEDGTPAGKADLFPISGRRAIRPTDALDDEHALLLNPSEETFKPEDHFQPKPDGTIQPKTPEAQTSCEMLGLNVREKLVKSRAGAYQSAAAELSMFFMLTTAAAVSGAPMNAQERKVRGDLNDIWEGRAQHSAFGRSAIEAAVKLLAANGIKIQFPLDVPPAP